MKKQAGAALVVVLSMLAISLMLGLSGMQSSLIDERLAGNYRASSMAQMAAERTVVKAQKSLLDADVKLSDWQWLGCHEDSTLENWEYPQCVNFAALDWEEEDFTDARSAGRYLYLQGEVLGLPGEYYIYALGEAYAEGSVEVTATSMPVYVELSPRFIPALSNLSPLTVVSRIFNFRSGGSSNFGISRQGEDNIGTAIAVADARDIDAVMDGIPSGRRENYATDEDGNIVTEQFFDVFSEPEKLKAFVDVIKDHPETSSQLGASSNPKVTYVDGDFTMPKDIGVAGGLLIVNGDFRWNGNNNFEGLIIVLGQDFTYAGGGSGSIVGALLHAPVVADHTGAWTYGIAEADASEIDLRGGGGSIIQHDVEVLNSVAQLIPSGAGSLFSAANGGLSEQTGFTIATWR